MINTHNFPFFRSYESKNHSSAYTNHLGINSNKRNTGKSALEGTIAYMGLSAEIFMPVLLEEKGKSQYYGSVGNKVLELKIERDGKYTHLQLTSTKGAELQVLSY